MKEVNYGPFSEAAFELLFVQPPTSSTAQLSCGQRDRNMGMTSGQTGKQKERTWLLALKTDKKLMEEQNSKGTLS